MRYFRFLNPKSKALIEAKTILGDAGLWQIACLAAEAQEQDIWELDVQTIVGWIKVKRDRAERILPFAQKILDETQEMLGKSKKISGKSQKISENTEQIVSKSEDFTPSNPHGSTRDLEIIDHTNREETHIQKCASEECEKFIDQARKYAFDSGNVNMQNFSWLDGYLTKQFTEIRSSRPEIPAEAVLKVWQECCDDASAKSVSAAKWYRTVFETRIESWTVTGPRLVACGRSPTGTMIAGNAITPSEARKGGSGKL